MFQVIFSVLPVILFFLLGYILRHRHFIRPESVRDIKKIVSSLALPALLFQAFASLQLEFRFLFLIILIFFICIFMVAIGTAAAKVLKIQSPYFAFLMGGYEMGMLGYALFLAIYGPENLSRFALMDLGQVIFVFFVLMTLLIREREGKGKPADLIRSFVTSPVILAIFSGIAVSFLQKAIQPSALTASLRQFLILLGNLTVPLIALMIGFELQFHKEGIRLAVKTVVLRKILLILAALAVNHFVIRNAMGLGKIYEYALFTMFLLPPPFVISIYMKQEDRDNLNYVNNTLSLSTVVSVICVILVSMMY